jgi:hypothetical protein
MNGGKSRFPRTSINYFAVNHPLIVSCKRGNKKSGSSDMNSVWARSGLAERTLLLLVQMRVLLLRNYLQLLCMQLSFGMNITRSAYLEILPSLSVEFITMNMVIHVLLKTVDF